VHEHLRAIWAEKHKAEAAQDPTFATIPRFYFRAAEPAAPATAAAAPAQPAPASPQSTSSPGAPSDERGAVLGAGPSSTSLARLKLLATARQRLLSRKASQLLSKAQLEQLWLLLSKHVQRPAASAPPSSSSSTVAAGAAAARAAAARAAGGAAAAAAAAAGGAAATCSTTTAATNLASPSASASQPAPEGPRLQPEPEPRITYDSFVTVAAQMPPGARDNYMRASHFLKFPIDEEGAILITPYFQWVMRRCSQFQSMLELSAYDTNGTGRLSEAQLENYLTDLLPTLPALHDLQESFVPFYVCTAVRKFFFFLDAKRRGHVRVRDMLSSPILNELLELRRARLLDDEAKNNWFSTQTALAVYGEYLQLDTDQNGMLCPSELAQYGGGGLTPPFIENLFQECQTYDGERPSPSPSPSPIPWP
jgi:hypothetical protein